MKTFVIALGLLLGVLDCARIYRPVTLVSPPPAATRSADLSGWTTPQPWGDNSRYEERAQKAGLRVVALSLENRSGAEVEVVGLQLPEGVEALSPEAAMKLVQQHSLAYLLYPGIPALLSLGASSSTAGLYLSERMIYGAFAVAGFLVGLPNALVAANSNLKLGTFFREQAWSPGRLAPGQSCRGLVFLRGREAGLDLPLRVIYRQDGAEQGLDLTRPAALPL